MGILGRLCGATCLAAFVGVAPLGSQSDEDFLMLGKIRVDRTVTKAQMLEQLRAAYFVWSMNGPLHDAEMAPGHSIHIIWPARDARPNALPQTKPVGEATFDYEKLSMFMLFWDAGGAIEQSKLKEAVGILTAGQSKTCSVSLVDIKLSNVKETVISCGPKTLRISDSEIEVSIRF